MKNLLKYFKKSESNTNKCKCIIDDPRSIMVGNKLLILVGSVTYGCEVVATATGLDGSYFLKLKYTDYSPAYVSFHGDCKHPGWWDKVENLNIVAIIN